jgi:hypothetical protein
MAKSQTLNWSFKNSPLANEFQKVNPQKEASNRDFGGGGLWKKDGGGAVEKIPRFGPLDWFAIMP